MDAHKAARHSTRNPQVNHDELAMQRRNFDLNTKAVTDGNIVNGWLPLLVLLLLLRCCCPIDYPKTLFRCC